MATTTAIARNMLFRVLFWGGLSVISLEQANAAGININATRVVITQESGTAILTTNNSSTKPYLMNIRFSRTVGGHEETPFVASPPLYRLEPHGSNSVKVLAQNTSMLPRDRESLFYLSAVGIPSSNPLSPNGEGYLSGGVSYAVGNTIKLFYRPDGLPSSALDAIKGLTFSKTTGGITVSNPSPYHVSLAALQLNGQKVTFTASVPSMLPPFGSVLYHIRTAYPISQAGKAEWQGINDQGGAVAASTTIQ